MSKQQVKTMKPFISVMILMFFLFVFAFIKMENRRIGYSYVKLSMEERKLRNQQREKQVRLAKMTGPERIQLVATQQLPMKKAVSGQIIRMTNAGVAIIQ